MSQHYYGQRLGMLDDQQFQAALDRFGLGALVRTEPITSGNFGQNVFVTTSLGEFVLRGSSHFEWQFPTEQFFADLLHKRSQLPIPWPYLLDEQEDIFGWSYALMPRLPGQQTTDPQFYNPLPEQDKRHIAQAMGTALAELHRITWPVCGRYDPLTQTIQPLQLQQELAWPFPAKPSFQQTPQLPFSQMVVSIVRYHLEKQASANSITSQEFDWGAQIIEQAAQAADDDFQPALVHADYSKHNLVVERLHGQWRVSGVFDLMGLFFGNSEMDLARPVATLLEEDKSRAELFLQAYHQAHQIRSGFASRFAMYMLMDRLVIWAFAKSSQKRWWDESLTFQQWAEPFVSFASQYV
ncbi:phosphotransferase family protein [Dictyobacter aurantiacus]|uniref:Aminoglycoside phosphotransferase domain-containing protein n=1 Tax=Dictyobacter aurantiacus TaxID=1936993 RepID=A0A401ZA80_9CHLR|nr:aminoglycoside phosphotransferase family protein [Dictyobacter aurantiacus]GCE03774.1 hypothetical protein KDAU_11030 [Dictyobacter aurantiacus]